MKTHKKIDVIVVAGGSGKRMKSSEPKQFMTLLGKPVLLHSLLPFQHSEMVSQIILVAPANELERCRNQIVDLYHLDKVTRIVAGGKERTDSVKAGLKALNSGGDYIAVHDGARPLIEVKIIEQVFNEAIRTGAAMLVKPVAETVKEVDDSGEVLRTISREKLRLAQTPQVFCAEWIKKAYDCFPANRQATDDACILEYAGYPVKTVCGNAANIKITTPDDLAIAEFILEQRSKDHENRNRI